jgi:chaperonin cofactor prefoldin
LDPAFYTFFRFQVAYQIGEVFVSMSQTDVQEALDKSKNRLTSEVEVIEEKMEAVKSQG